jgi:CheY-like chemotaxis protein
LEVLADYLYQKFSLQDQGGQPDAPVTAAEAGASDEALEWLKSAPVSGPLELGQALPDVWDLLQPLALRHSVQFERQLENPPLFVVVHPVAFDQILLNLLSLAITRAPGSRIALSVERLAWAALISFQGTRPELGAQPIYEEKSQRLRIARQLVTMSKGTLEITEAAHGYSVKLALPCVDQLSVIAIDDNPDTLSLFQRYTVGTPYHLITTRDPEQILTLAEKSLPHAIVLDVMMPDVDGWKLLGRLRQHPLVYKVPLIVCTILPQQELALSLGASAFLKKPVTRPDFLAALDRQVALRE